MSRLTEEFRARTKAFAAGAFRLYRFLPHQQRETEVVGHQLLRAATSVAANVQEASRARSDDEFVAKLGISLQETDESQLWLEFLNEECGIVAPSLQDLLRESDELIAIYVSTISKTKRL